MSIILWLHHRSGPLTKDKTSYLRILHIYSRNEYDVFHTEPQPLEESSTFFCFRRSFALTAEPGTHCDPVCLDAKPTCQLRSIDVGAKSSNVRDYFGVSLSSL